MINMIKTEIVDFSKCESSKKNGSYGGNGGPKEGIIYNGQNWIIKYPKKLKNKLPGELNYINSPISEYIGSNIYKTLGYPVQDVLLGIRNNKLIVACKDFTSKDRLLLEYRTIKNVYDKKLLVKLDSINTMRNRDNILDIDEILPHLKHNPLFNSAPDIEFCFWNMVVIDCFVSNDKRTSSDWGLIFESDKYKFSPIFGNGNSFNNRVDDGQLAKIMKNKDNFIKLESSRLTNYSRNGKILNTKELLSLWREYPKLADAIKNNYVLIKKELQNIENVIDSIPNSYNGLKIISDTRKKYYKDSLNVRMKYLFEITFKENEK